MKRTRVLAYVTRERDGRRELLVFDHRDDPEAGTQVPAGRPDPGEALEDALFRELNEEAGLDRVRIVRRLGVVETSYESKYENHAFELEVDGAPDAWDHVVFGDGDDAGLVFRYRWVPLEPDLPLWGGRGDPVLAVLHVRQSDPAGRA